MTIISGIWPFVEKLSILFSFLAAIFAFWSWLKLRQQNNKIIEIAEGSPEIETLAEQIDFHSKVNSLNPIALAVSLIPTVSSIKNDVEIFLKFQHWKMKIEELTMDGINNKNDLMDYCNNLRRMKRVLSAKGVTELHLFIQGPVMAGVIAGAIFDNWVPIKLYHKPTPSHPQIYEYWMPLIK
jgi:hypothetical protein